MSGPGEKIDLTNYNKLKDMMAASPAPTSPALDQQQVAPPGVAPPSSIPSPRGLTPEAAADLQKELTDLYNDMAKKYPGQVTVDAQGAESQAASPVTAPPTQQSKGFVANVVDYAKGLIPGVGKEMARDASNAAGVAAGALRVPGQAIGATADFINDSANAIFDHTVLPFGEWLNKGTEQFPGQKAIAASILAEKGITRKGSMADLLSAKDYLGKVGNSSVNQGVASIGSLILGTMVSAESKLFKNLPTIAKGALSFGTAATVVGDPDSARLSTALSNLGVHSEFTDWLAADDKDTGAMEKRFKNGLEGVLSGAALDATFQGAKYLYGALKGVPNMAAKEAAENSLKEMLPEASIPKDPEVTSVRGAGTQDIRVDGETVATVPRPNMDAINEEAVKAHQSTPSEGIVPEEASPSAAKDPGPFPGIDNEAITPLLRSMAIKLHDTPHVVRTDAERNAMAIAAAQEVGVDPTDMIAFAQHVAGNLKDADVGVTAAQVLWRKMAGDLDMLSIKGLAETAPEADITAHKTAIANVVNYSGAFQDIRSSLGRGLRSTSILKRVTDYAGEKLGIDDLSSKIFKESNPIPPQPNTIQEINDFYSVWNDLKGDAAARQNFLRGINTLPSQWLYLRTSFANNFTANALAGLPSLSMNTVGPSIIGVLHTLEKTTGGFMGALNPLLSPAERAASLSVATNASRAYVQTISQIPDAFRYAMQAVKENRSILGGSNTVDVGRMGPVTPQMIRAAGMQDGPTLGYQLGNLINFWPRNFQRINNGLDEFAKRLSYMGEVRLNAAVEYDTKAAGSEAFATKGEYIKSAMENSVDAVGEATSEEALRTAERTTLTGSLSGNDYHPIVGKASDFVQAMRSQFPETRYIIPVFNVPANSLGETMRRIPFVNMAFGETRDELLGHLGTVRQADAYGRTMLGAGFMLWAYNASRNGQLTGSGPSDGGDRKAWSDQGYQPYSIRVGDKWVNYSRYDLPGALLALPANMYDSTVYHRQDDPGYEARMVASIGSLAQYFKDKAALQGASNLMNFGASPGADESFLNQTLNSVVSKTFVPNFITQLGRSTTDDLKRSATSPAEALMNSIPMLSQKLDPLRNVLGEPLHAPRDTLIENMAPITIAPATTFKSDPVMTELDRLRQATGFAGGVTHHTEFDGGYFNATQTKLEDGRSLYDHLISSRQTVVDPNTGNNLRAALQQMFNSPEYKQAKDADASNLMDSAGNVSRGAVISKVFAAYNKASIQAVAQSSPEARKWLAITAAKKIDDARLRPYSAGDLASTPELLKSLGINLKDYEAKVSGQPNE